METGDVRVAALAFGDDSRTLIAITAGGSAPLARTYKIDTAEEVGQTALSNYAQWFAISSNSRWVASTAGSSVDVFDVVEGEWAAQFYHQGMALYLTFSADGRWLAIGGTNDGVVRIWDVSDGFDRGRTPVVRMPHQNWVNAVAFSHDGRLVATGDYLKARVWGVETGDQVAEFSHPSVDALALSRDNRLLASASSGTVYLWDVAAEEEVARIVHGGPVRALAFSEEGHLATAGGPVARIWDIGSGLELNRVVHEGRIDSLAFSRDGRWLATGSLDGTARVWARTLERNDLILEACNRIVHELNADTLRRYFGEMPVSTPCQEFRGDDG